MKKVNIIEGIKEIDEYWSPVMVGTVNDHDVKIAKFKGEFDWHHHSDTDELFLILKGKVQIELESGSKALQEGDVFVVKKGISHKPVALDEAHVMMIEKRGTINTGNVVNERTKTNLKTL